MKEPNIDYGLCIGCGVCVELCPEVFEMRDEKAWVVEPGNCGACNCEEAVATCPVNAIEWEE